MAWSVPNSMHGDQTLNEPSKPPTKPSGLIEYPMPEEHLLTGPAECGHSAEPLTPRSDEGT